VTAKRFLPPQSIPIGCVAPVQYCCGLDRDRFRTVNGLWGDFQPTIRNGLLDSKPHTKAYLPDARISLRRALPIFHCPDCSRAPVRVLPSQLVLYDPKLVVGQNESAPSQTSHRTGSAIH
jgi:hypothetical protein